MEINQKFNFIEGAFDTKTGKLVCISSNKYVEVKLAFKDKTNIPFAKIRLHSKDTFIDARDVFKDAENLGDEIVKRWNEYSEVDNHYICEIKDTLNDYHLVLSMYCDVNTDTKALEHFKSIDRIKTYIGNDRYQIYIRQNPLYIQ